ncbi:MAG: DUF6115 domain-containing protein [Lachnospiraceae bacterium]
MSGAELILLIIGAIFLLIGFLIPDRQTQESFTEKSVSVKEDQYTELLEKAEMELEEKMMRAIEPSINKMMLDLESFSNQKMKAISNQADEANSSVSKVHDELMFLYSILTDRQKDADESTFLIDHASHMLADAELSTRKDSPRHFEINTSEGNNRKILDLFQEGYGVLDIAKQLELGVGEVSLVIGLYKGESSH